MDAGSLVSHLRLLKSTTEFGYIREACRYAEAALLPAVAACRLGCAENHVAAAMLTVVIEAVKRWRRTRSSGRPVRHSRELGGPHHLGLRAGIS